MASGRAGAAVPVGCRALQRPLAEVSRYREKRRRYRRDYSTARWAPKVDEAVHRRGSFTGYATQTRTVLAEDIGSGRTQVDDRSTCSCSHSRRRSRMCATAGTVAADDEHVLLCAPLPLVLDTFEGMQYAA